MTQNTKAIARDRNLLGGIVTGLGGRGIGLLAPFLVMPAMLEHLGEANFGIWMTVVSITSMAMFMYCK
jgi:O-antigen/teichoic acid export membrane protein